MRAIYLLILICISTEYCNAQAPQWTWVNAIGGTQTEGNGGSGIDGGHTVASDANGNVYVTGHFSSGTLTLGTYTLTCSGNADIFVVKYDSTGSVLWAQKAGGSGYDASYGIAVDNSGNVYITGCFESTVINFGSQTYNNVISNGNTADIFIAKYDANGNFQWARTAGNSASDAAKSVTTDPAGNAYISGEFGGASLLFGTITVTGNYFLTKYDPNGNVVWAQGASPGGYPYVYSNASDSYGNIYVAGVFFNQPVWFGNDTLINASGSGTADIFVTKYDSAGNVLWARGAGGPDADMAYCVFADDSGNAFVTGTAISPSFPFGSGAFVNYDNTGMSKDIYVLKYDAAGNEMWVISAGGNDDDAGLSIADGPFGNLYLTGNFNSMNVVLDSFQLSNSTPNTAESFLIQMNAAGSFIWGKTMNGAGNDWGRSVTVNASGDLYTSGTFASSSFSFGNFTLTNAGFPDQDMYVAKIRSADLMTNTNEANATIAPSLFPNPARNNFLLQVPENSGVWRYTITNTTGQVMGMRNNFTQSVAVSTEEWPDGVYFVMMSDGLRKYNLKVVVCR